jgi:hypothetical protein
VRQASRGRPRRKAETGAGFESVEIILDGVTLIKELDMEVASEVVAGETVLGLATRRTGGET